MSADTPLDDLCAFCGDNQPKGVVFDDDGEWYCSAQCYVARAEFGSPQGLDESARDTMVSYALNGPLTDAPRRYKIACRRGQWVRAAWLESQSAERWCKRLVRAQAKS